MSACLFAPLSALPILIIGYQVQLVQCKCFAPPVDLVCLIVRLQLLSAQVKTAIGSFFVLSIMSVCSSVCTSHLDDRLSSAIGFLPLCLHPSSHHLCLVNHLAIIWHIGCQIQAAIVSPSIFSSSLGSLLIKTIQLLCHILTCWQF